MSAIAREVYKDGMQLYAGRLVRSSVRPLRPATGCTSSIVQMQEMD